MTVSRETPAGRQRILVIKQGALGDFVLAMGPAAAIRAYHAGAHITLLTTSPFVPLAEASGYFDAVWTDSRAKLWRFGVLLSLRRRLRDARFDRVYDLQTSTRTSLYFHMMGPGHRPEWCGIASGCSHRHGNPQRNFMHTVERQAEQLRVAGIPSVPAPDLSWAHADLGRFAISSSYVLLVPGGAAHRPEKRWPASAFADLAEELAKRGLKTVLLGTAVDRVATARVSAACGTARDLTGETSLFEIAALARGAAGAVGNDTGPMHLIAAAGCPALVLFSADSDPVLAAPRPGAQGGRVEVLRRERLADLSVAEVLAALHLRDS